MRLLSGKFTPKSGHGVWKAIVASLGGADGATLATAFDPKNNAIGFLRFFFAAMVVFSHSFPLGGFNTEPLWQFSRGHEHFGTLGVICFFIVSGFLITRSQVSSKSIVVYLWHRFLRIMPGFWACLLVTVVLFAPLAHWIEHGSLPGFRGAYGNEALAYLKANWMLDIHLNSIGDLLQRIPFKSAFNGSLWTLGYEFRCYLCVAVLGIFGCTRRLRAITLLITLYFYAAYAFFGASPETLARLLPRFVDGTTLKLSLYFFAGAVLFLYREYIPVNRWLALAALAAAVCSLPGDWFRAAGPPCVTYLVLYTACRLPVTRFDRQGDFSYGLYLYAFPVQQLLSSATLNRAGFFAYFLCALTISTGFGMLSYFGVERPALGLKSFKPSLPGRGFWKSFNGRLRA